MLSLVEAAKLLGYSTSGLRKLCKNGLIRFFQVKPHSPLKFKREWIDEFIEQKSHPTEVEKKQDQKLPKRLPNRFGI